MSIYSKPRAIAKPNQPGTPTTGELRTIRVGCYNRLHLDGRPVKWRNYEWIDDVLHSVFEEVTR